MFRAKGYGMGVGRWERNNHDELIHQQTEHGTDTRKILIIVPVLFQPLNNDYRYYYRSKKDTSNSSGTIPTVEQLLPAPL